VFQPSFLPGFGASVDFFNIDIKDAIVTLGSQNYVDRCFAGETALCSYIERDASGAIAAVKVLPANVLSQTARGIDFETSYRFQLSDFVESLDGGITLRALASKYLKLETIDGAFTVDGAGVLADGAGGFASTGGMFAPDIKYLVSATYSGEAFSSTLTARGWNSGVYNNSVVVCTTGCPASTVAVPTIGFENKVPGVVYIDLALNYKLMEGTTEVFLVTENLFNKQPPIVGAPPGNAFYSGLGNKQYDLVGRAFRLGARFKY